MNRLTLRALSLLVCYLAFGGTATLAVPPTVNGKLDKIGDITVLRVWGTPQEMGFAHGYLVGDGVLTYLAERIASVSPERRGAVDAAQTALAEAIQTPDESLVEIRGMFDGIKAAGGDVPTIKGLDRPLRLEDLIIANAADTLRAFGCSGFTVWGDKAGEAGVITTRNFDFPVPGPETLKRQMILVRRPTGRRAVATITFPGYLGAVTGINEDGVCVFVHDGTGGRIRTPQGRYTPLGLVLKDLLESAGRARAHDRAESMLRGITPYPFSYMVRVITPRSAGRDKPVRVFQVDRNGLGENATGKTTCITTNHYIARGLKPHVRANDWSKRRYDRLDKRVRATVTDRMAWESLRAVMPESQEYATLHSLVVYPERGELDLALATWRDGKVVAAPIRKPTRISFGWLFKSAGR